jgi:hypothetical protein
MESGIGLGILTKSAQGINRIIAEIDSENRGFAEKWSVERTIEQYQKTLIESVRGKNGLLRETIMPVFPTTIRGVVTPYIPSKSGELYEIALPRKAFNRLWASSETFRNIYGKNKTCIIKRDPVHWKNSVIGVKFVLWNNDTIGVPPWIMRVLDGDFDGDACIAMFPTTPEGVADIAKMFPDLSESFKPAKNLFDAEVNTIREKIVENTGIVSTFGNLHESDTLKNSPLFSLLTKNPSQKEIMKEALLAIADFDTVKSGTALTGALGLKFIFTRTSTDLQTLDRAMEFYHKIAQNTLDAKGGTAVPALTLVDAFRKTQANTMAVALKMLEFTDEASIKELISLSLNMSRDKGSDQYLRTRYPVLAVMQRNASEDSVMELARVTTADDIPMTGVWELMFRSLLKGNRKWLDAKTKLNQEAA